VWRKNAKSVRIRWLVLAKCCQHKTLRRHNVISFVYNVLQLIHLHCVCGRGVGECSPTISAPGRQTHDKGCPFGTPTPATAFTTPSANAFLSTAFPVFTESQSERFLCAFNALSKMVQV